MELKQSLQIPKYNFIVEETHWKGRGTKVTLVLPLGGKVNGVFLLSLSLFFQILYNHHIFSLYSGKFFLKKIKRRDGDQKWKA